jgi:hypothetical protein
MNQPLNVIELFSTFGTWFTGIATGVSVIFLARQINLLRKDVISSSYHNIHFMMIDIDKEFVQYPQYRKFFYEKMNPDSVMIQLKENDDIIKVTILCEMMADYFDNVYHHRKTVPNDAYNAFKQYMREIYKSSIVFQAYLDIRHKWFPGGVMRMLGEDGSKKDDAFYKILNLMLPFA